MFFITLFLLFRQKSARSDTVFSYIEYMHYFGTDGIRNKADWLLTNEIPYALGKVLAKRGGKIIIARDVREHSLDVENSCAKGLWKVQRKYGLQACCQRLRLRISHN